MEERKPTISVGVAGWSYPDWAGVVYPDKRARGGLSELAYLARYLDAMEINTTFYRPAVAAMSARWVAQVADRPEFIFTAKLWQRFTHERAQPWTSAEAATFSDGIEPLRESGRLGALLMQFPWSFRPAQPERDWLSRLTEQFCRFHCVVEVRHEEWDTPENIEFLRSRGLGFCNIDQPGIGGNLRATNHVIGPVGYYRFHGRNAKAWFNSDAGRNERYNYLYSEKELAPWVERIGAAVSKGKSGRMCVITNNHFFGQAVVNALEFKSRFAGRRVPVPKPLLARYPALEKYAVKTELF